MQGRDAAATRNRILDACEQVYATEGVEGLTLRTITERAAVNLASVNYHFGTKEVLTAEMLKRRVMPIHQERQALLDSVEAHFGTQIRPTHVLGATIIPLLNVLTTPNAPLHLLSFLLRSSSDPAAIVRHAMESTFQHVSDRVDAAFARSAFHMQRDDAVWRSRVFFNAFPGTVANQNLVTMLIDMLKTPNVTAFDTLLQFGTVLECVMHHDARDDTVADLARETLTILARAPALVTLSERIALLPGMPAPVLVSPFPTWGT
ncbi:TetR/AcrR family transcriptional regulator [Robbsia sp. KACC 23696]|uniref:TetR/AcrR family transcriptional regulator n=1 Tax=Robbsia sp. KACC 23696 TaxID=3149231 RepID=UPI00325B4460